MFMKIKVKSHSGRQEIEKKENYYLVHLKSPAEDNKANIELLKLLKKYLGKKARIKSGFTSRNKLVEITD